MTYGIWTTIDFGVTGSRSAWLKSDGKPMTFATEAEAETYATALTNRNTLNGGYSPSGRAIAYRCYRAAKMDA